MRLSTQTDYAVRTVFELAQREPGAVVQTRDIAAAQGLPEGYLAKVIQSLVRAGVLHSSRGTGGGVSLARPRAEISVRDVFEAIDGPLELHRCDGHSSPCDAGTVRHSQFLAAHRGRAHGRARAHGFRGAGHLPAWRRGGRRGSRHHVSGEVNQMKEEVEKALSDIRPALQADGGDIELVDVTDDGVVQVRLMGHCAGCPMSQMTLTHGVERHLKNVVPGVARVENVLV